MTWLGRAVSVVYCRACRHQWVMLRVDLDSRTTCPKCHAGSSSLGNPPKGGTD